MIYLDTSSLLKLLFLEPESEAVRFAIAAEDRVLISSLAEVETHVQLKAARLGGVLRKSQQESYIRQLQKLKAADPFHFVPLSGELLALALRLQTDPATPHCQTLDLLHLAAMLDPKVKRIMTHDANQAKVAATLGFEVSSPQPNL